MEVLLTLFVALTAIAVVTQAGVLVAIYVLSKRLAHQLDRLMKESREMMRPLKAVTENLRSATAHAVVIGVSARKQFQHVEDMLTDTGEALQIQLARVDQMSQEIRGRISETARAAQESIMRPVRELGAIAKGFSRGVEVFLFRKRRVDEARQDEELFI